MKVEIAPDPNKAMPKVLKAEHCLRVTAAPCELLYDVRYHDTDVLHPTTRRWRHGPVKKVITVYTVVHGRRIVLGAHEESLT